MKTSLWKTAIVIVLLLILIFIVYGFIDKPKTQIEQNQRLEFGNSLALFGVIVVGSAVVLES